MSKISDKLTSFC